jgi:predicted nucleotidyltransferase component of viral defense system
MADLILPNPKDAIHKAWLLRTLMGIYKDSFLATVLYFKGGTCAAMLGYLDRFSIDLDFDFVGTQEQLAKTQTRLEAMFIDLNLVIHDKSKTVPQYFLKYEARSGERNTIKIDTTFPAPKANTYESKRFYEIDRIITCQTIETMFANKLVALIDRYQHHEAIAGRDLYDIHHFFLQGYRYNEQVIAERTGKTTQQFFGELIGFVEKYITNEIISQDLNTLLPYDAFSRIRKTLKQETLMFLRNEQPRLSQP